MAKPISLKAVSRTVHVSDGMLGTILEKLTFEVVTTPYQIEHEIVQIKFARLTLSNCKTYLVTFVFDKNQKGKLFRLTDEVISDTVDILKRAHYEQSDINVILVGKSGSRQNNKLLTVFNDFGIAKLLLYDFTSSQKVEEFIFQLIEHIDKIEHRLMADLAKADLANLPLSDKKIRLNNDGDTKRIVFANTLLQVPGITEKIALAIADKFGSPGRLLTHIGSGKNLTDFTFVDSKGDVKKYVLYFACR